MNFILTVYSKPLHEMDNIKTLKILFAQFSCINAQIVGHNVWHALVKRGQGETKSKLTFSCLFIGKSIIHKIQVSKPFVK